MQNVTNDSDLVDKYASVQCPYLCSCKYIAWDDVFVEAQRERSKILTGQLKNCPADNSDASAY